MNTEIDDYLKDIKNKYKDEEKLELKLEYLNVIIEVNLYDKHRDNIKNEQLYYYVKAWIELYINIKIKNMKYGYDIINMESIHNQINEFYEAEKKQRLYKYTKSLLVNHFHNSKDINECQEKIKELEIEILTDSHNIIDLFKLILLCSSKNFINLFLSIFICVTIISLMLIPDEKTIIIKYVSYCDNTYLNHFINITSYLFNLSNNGFEIYINSIGSLIAVIMAKLIFIVIVFNYIIIELYRKVFNHEFI